MERKIEQQVGKLLKGCLASVKNSLFGPVVKEVQMRKMTNAPF